MSVWAGACIQMNTVVILVDESLNSERGCMVASSRSKWPRWAMDAHKCDYLLPQDIKFADEDAVLWSTDTSAGEEVWIEYVERMEMYFTANGVGGKKQAIFCQL